MQPTVGLILLAGAFSACHPRVKPPAIAPREHFILHDKHEHGVFTTQRWVSEARPEVSPAGMCECITVAYRGARRVVTFGDGTIDAVSVDPISGRDINGDGAPELVFNQWSGGAHCCFTTTVYSVPDPPAEPKSILALGTGDCNGSFEDLDGDGTMEFVACDAGWGMTYCSFAESPFPTVVFAYDPAKRAYVPATPRFGSRYVRDIDAEIKEVEKQLAEPGRTADADKCTVLRPALALMYSGRFDEGVALIERLYRHPDRTAFLAETVEKVHGSPFWVAP